jgi:anti-anti-sigma factor
MIVQPSARHQPFSLLIDPSGEGVALRPVGELDLASIGRVQREAGDLYHARFAHVLIDLSQVTFMDSAGLCGLLELRHECVRTGRSLVLTPGPPTVHRLFTITGTRGLFDWSAR